MAKANPVTAGTALRWALLILALAPFVYYVIAVIAARRFFRPRIYAASSFTPPISILKPIFGLDREAYENFASFCRQDYPEYEILFCVSDLQDPAVPVIRKLIDDFPDRSIRLLIGADRLGVSDKVNKLCRMVRQSRHDVVIVSDSDVRVEPGFLRAIVAPFSDPKVGGVTCLYRGLTDGSLAADLEAVGNSTDFAAGVLVAWLLRPVNFMLGAVMATTKKHLAEIGGFELLVDYFSDDYELGNRIAARGYRIELSNFPVSIVYPRESFADAFHHQLRWNLSIRYSRPWGHLGLIFTQGFAWTLVGCALAPTELAAFAYIAAYILLAGEMVRAIGIYGMKDVSLRKKYWQLTLRGAFAFTVWVASFFPQRIRWRDQQFHVRQKRLVAVPPRQSQ
ncbi:MAG TPA: bacteriohopanetetrol glucosamine biosynthesis glycosyltransferase HpnI [Candidatus Limnocylindria bacterium]|nr:bacteriohopanetetrol glucosamine biosynthesis glycosyltransferase HpnI [Candidatus Limnocylindria bacterium]